MRSMMIRSAEASRFTFRTPVSRLTAGARGFSRSAPALSCIVVLAVATLAAQEPVDEKVIAQIKEEGFQRSAVMDTLSWLTDVHGPRLTGSPQLRAAGEWARAELTRWGLANAALESYGSIGRGWTLERYSIEIA